MKTHTFETVDADGVAHKITTQAIPFDEGNGLLMDIGGLLGDTGAAAMSSGDIAKAFRTLSGKSGADLMVRLFTSAKAHRSTVRETVDPNSGIVERSTVADSLANAAVRNAVFAANYGEAYEIAIEILRFNFAPFLTDAWGKLSGRYGSLIAKATGITLPTSPLNLEPSTDDESSE